MASGRERQHVACLACERWKREAFAHSWGKASPQSLRRDGEWGRTALKTLIMISDSNTISSLVRCPLRVHHCLDYCQDLLFRCWVSPWTQLSFLYNSSFFISKEGQGKPCSFSDPAILPEPQWQSEQSRGFLLTPWTGKCPKVSLKTHGLCQLRPVT